MSGLTLTAVWDGQAFVPDHVFLDDCQTIKRGAQVTIALSVDRNPEALRYWHWILTRICESGSWNGTKDSLDYDFTRTGVGFGKWRALSDGRSVFIPDSVALSRCDEMKFRRLLFFAERLWAERLGVDVEAIKREVSASQRRAA